MGIRAADRTCNDELGLSCYMGDEKDSTPYEYVILVRGSRYD